MRDIKETVDQSLTHLASQSLAPFDEEQAAVIITEMGDAFRLGVRVPAPLRSWLAARDPNELSLLCDRARLNLEAIGVPAASDKGDGIEDSVRMRDRAESTSSAVQAASMMVSEAPVILVAGWKNFQDTLESYDIELGRRFSSLDVEAALGERAAICGLYGWTARLADTATSEAEDVEAADLPAIVGERPPDHVVNLYVIDGAHAGWVQAAAKNNAEFANELAETIDILHRSGETLPFMPRRWRAMCSDASGVESETGWAAAASSSDVTAIRTDELGVLFPVDATALLVSKPGQLELRVTAGKMPLASISLGDARSTEPGQSGTWMVRTQHNHGSICIEILATDGTRFFENVDIIPPTA